MDHEQREAIREANRRRGNCPKCGAHGADLAVVDGTAVGGLPGIKYKHCFGCGWCRAITRRPPRFKL